MSYDTPEGRVVKRMLDYANALPHCVAHKVHGDQYNAGEPDLDIVCNGRAVKIEVKTPGTEASIRKRITPLQRASLASYGRAGAIVGVCVSVEELTALLLDAQPFDKDQTLQSYDDALALIKRVRARLD